MNQPLSASKVSKVKTNQDIIPYEMVCSRKEPRIEQQPAFSNLAVLEELSTHNRLPQYYIVAEEHDIVRQQGSTLQPTSFVGFDTR